MCAPWTIRQGDSFIASTSKHPSLFPFPSADQCCLRLLEKGQSFDAFPWALRAAGQTIGEVAVDVDLKMLDK
jgi:hypothetical protein